MNYKKRIPWNTKRCLAGQQIQKFIKPKASVPCPQEPTAGHHPKTHFILAYPHIYAYVSQMVSPFVFSNHPRVWFYVTIDKYFTGLKGTLV